MNKFYWLVKREFWEHRGSFLWAPAITAGVVVVLNILSLIAAEVSGGPHWGSNAIWLKIGTGSPEDLRQVASILDFSAMVPAGIVGIVLFFVLFRYCMNNLSTDRSDRSILFWKSLPVSDLATVVSKAFSAVILAPVIAVITGLIGAFLMLLTLAIAATFHGVGFGQIMWGLPHLGSIAYVIGGLLPVYIVWMLPTVGWLMMCSAWARGRVTRWAILLPIAVGVILSWLSIMGPLSRAAHWYWPHVAGRILLGVLPGSWTWAAGITGPVMVFGADQGNEMRFHGISDVINHMVSSQYHLLATPGFLWGALAGFIMIGIAVWLRRWRTEL